VLSVLESVSVNKPARGGRQSLDSTLSRLSIKLRYAAVEPILTTFTATAKQLEEGSDEYRAAFGRK